MEIQPQLIEMIANADRAGANRLLEEWMAVHGDERTFLRILGAVLEEVGERWQEREEFSLAQAYVAAKIAEDAMNMLRESSRDRPMVTDRKKTAVLGNIEDDFHSLGRRMVTTFRRGRRARSWFAAPGS